MCIFASESSTGTSDTEPLTVLCFICADADVNHRNKFGISVIQSAVAYQNNLNVIKMLVEQGIRNVYIL